MIQRAIIRRFPVYKGFFNMAKKQFFCIVDTETTIENTVADFAAIIVDRKGRIYKQCAVLVKGEFGAKDLFHDEKAGELWNKKSLDKRMQNYQNMLNEGHRMMASPAAINRWLLQAASEYNAELTAYNLPFDMDKCKNTGIFLDAFNSKFCLWKAANSMICTSKQYRNFVLENHLFNAPTEKGNMTYKTNAEAVCGFITGNMIAEPHTALEDARDFELPILQNIVNRKNWREKISQGYDWQARQVKNWYIAK